MAKRAEEGNNDIKKKIMQNGCLPKSGDSYFDAIPEAVSFQSKDAMSGGPLMACMLSLHNDNLVNVEYGFKSCFSTHEK